MPDAEFRKMVKTDRYQVFLFTCRANLPFFFASHPWFVVNDHGNIARYGVLFESRHNRHRKQYLFKDALPPTHGISVFPYWHRWYWKSTLRGVVEGGDDSAAARLARVITGSLETYPHAEEYAFTGPNSNSYAGWVLAQVPESGLSLPRNSFGKSRW